MRLFLALQPPIEIARALHARAVQLLGHCAGALRFYAAEELHLTLVFLGERDPPVLKPLGGPPLELELAGGGAFPDQRRPRVVWAGARELPGSEGRLEQIVRDLRVRLGMPPEEEPFQAHLTLARPRGGGRVQLPEALARLAVPGHWEANELILFESRPEAEPRYEARARIPLAR